jgi:hypothetical protein
MKKRIAAIAAILVFAGAAPIARADTWVFKDALRPHGHSRPMSAKLADAHSCGAIGHSISDDLLPSLRSCMQAHGWVLDHILADPRPRYAGHTRERSNGEDEALQKRNWDAANDAERQRDEEARNDESQRQMQDQINNDAMMSTLNNGQ